MEAADYSCFEDKDKRIAELEQQLTAAKEVEAVKDAELLKRERCIEELGRALDEIDGYATKCIDLTLKKWGEDKPHESHIHFVSLRNMAYQARAAAK